MFKAITMLSWEDAWALGRNLDDIFIFRGSPKSSFGLKPSLERSIEQACKDGTVANLYDFGDLMRDREKWVLNQFKRRAHHYLTSLPSENDTLEWLALIQHYGGPTRLLDVTHSFAIATYFAIDGASEDAVIWAFNCYSLRDIVKERTNITSLGRPVTEMFYSEYRRLAEQFISGDASGRLILPVEPQIMNERLSVQQGLFLFPSDLSMTFEQNLIDTIRMSGTQTISAEPVLYKKDEFNKDIIRELQLIKIVLPKKIHFRARHELWKMNISATTLFPGLDGFARSLNHYVTFE